MSPDCKSAALSPMPAGFTEMELAPGYPMDTLTLSPMARRDGDGAGLHTSSPSSLVFGTPRRSEEGTRLDGRRDGAGLSAGSPTPSGLSPWWHRRQPRVLEAIVLVAAEMEIASGFMPVVAPLEPSSRWRS